MTYYAFIENEQINGCGQCRCLNPETTNIEITQEAFNNIQDYVYLNGEIVINPELDNIKLQQAKDDKIKINDTARDEALNQGVTYEGILFDSDTDQKVNLLATIETLQEGETITWFGMNNQPLVCDKEDLMNIGGLIILLHNFCWNKNAFFKDEINNAATIEEVEVIEIDYTLPIQEEAEPEIVEGD